MGAKLGLYHVLVKYLREPTPDEAQNEQLFLTPKHPIKEDEESKEMRRMRAKHRLNIPSVASEAQPTPECHQRAIEWQTFEIENAQKLSAQNKAKFRREFALLSQQPTPVGNERTREQGLDQLFNDGEENFEEEDLGELEPAESISPIVLK